MKKKLSPAEWNQFQNYVLQADHHEIYKLHMAQVRDTRKMFQGDAEMLAKVDAIAAKILKTYQQACQEAA
jgi:hypothetical protein